DRPGGRSRRGSGRSDVDRGGGAPGRAADVRVGSGPAMTGESTGFRLALDEFEEIQSLAAGQRAAFRVEESGQAQDGWLPGRVSPACAEFAVGPGGQPLAARERAIVMVPASFPFCGPAVRVRHDRFAGLPYVMGGRQICLYHSDADWNPADGM